MPRTLCKFIDPKLSNIAQGPEARGQYLTTDGQQICIMLKASGLICFVI